MRYFKGFSVCRSPLVAATIILSINTKKYLFSFGMMTQHCNAGTRMAPALGRRKPQLKMVTLVPSMGSCRSHTGGERRLAECLEQKLDDDCLVWYDVPTGPRHQHPDFVIVDPRHGLLILEVKDFRLSTIEIMNKFEWDIRITRSNSDKDGAIQKTIPNPLMPVLFHQSFRWMTAPELHPS